MPDQRNLKRRALDHIHGMFLSGKLNWGDLVSEEAIAREIGISRTPIREALHVFTQMGVLQRVPRYGTVVRTPDLRVFEELFEVRKALECYAVDVATPLITVEELDRLEETCQQMRSLLGRLDASETRRTAADQSNEMFRMDFAFHQGIIRATGNGMLMKNVNDNRVLVRILGTARVLQLNAVNVGQICAEHESILKAVESREPARARELLARHIDSSKAWVLTSLKKCLNAVQNKEEDGRLGLDF